jgi:hypothetical protein
MAKQVILYNLREDVNEEDYAEWCNEFKGPLILGLPSTKKLTLMRMSAGKKGNGKEGIAPEDAEPPYRFIGVLDIRNREEYVRDMGSKAYQEDFFPQWFNNWVADFYAIPGDEVFDSECE